jgi:hypothetical protein
VANSIPEFFFWGDILFRFIIQGFFFVANFRHLEKIKWGGGGRGLANPTKGFFEILKKNSPYLERKKLEVARFR